VLVNGTRIAKFSIAAGAVNAIFDDTSSQDMPISGGTIAGQVSVGVVLAVQAQVLNPNDRPVSSNIERQAPVIASVVPSTIANGLQLVITGFATSRAVSSASFTFSAGSDVTFSGSAIAVPTSDAATTWFSKPDSLPYGGQFVYTQPFTLSGAGV